MIILLLLVNENFSSFIFKSVRVRQRSYRKNVVPTPKDAGKHR